MGGLGGAPAGSQTRTGGPLAGGWHRRELTPEEIAEQNVFFRAWIEKVVVSPPVGVDVRARTPRPTCRTAFGSCGDSAPGSDADARCGIVPSVS
jgi:hypothetical protein